MLFLLASRKHHPRRNVCLRVRQSGFYPEIGVEVSCDAVCMLLQPVLPEFLSVTDIVDSDLLGQAWPSSSSFCRFSIKNLILCSRSFRIKSVHRLADGLAKTSGESLSFVQAACSMDDMLLWHTSSLRFLASASPAIRAFAAAAPDRFFLPFLLLLPPLLFCLLSPAPASAVLSCES